MKALVVYYSRTGITGKVGEKIAKMLKADVDVIASIKCRKGVIGYLISGKEAMQKSLTDIEDYKIDPSKYDLVVIGGPVWGWTMSSPVRTYLTRIKAKLAKKKLAFFCTQGGSGAETKFKHMEELIGKKPIAKLAFTTSEVLAAEKKKETNKMVEKKVKEFVRKLKKK